MSITVQHRPSLADRISIAVLVGVGIVIAGGAVVKAVIGIADAAGNHDIPVLAQFAQTVAEAPIGPDGAMREVRLDQAHITAHELPAASFAALLAQHVFAAVGVVGFVVCLSILSLNFLRGRIFCQANTIAVSVAAVGGLLVWFVVTMLGNMVANGAFARISGRTFDNVVISVPVEQFILGGFAAAVACTAFSIGDRLRRDTEGLV